MLHASDSESLEKIYLSLKQSLMNTNLHHRTLEIDLLALKSNVEIFKSYIKDTKQDKIINKIKKDIIKLN